MKTIEKKEKKEKRKKEVGLLLLKVWKTCPLIDTNGISIG
jgi:hypothetical protein